MKILGSIKKVNGGAEHWIKLYSDIPIGSQNWKNTIRIWNKTIIKCEIYDAQIETLNFHN